MASSGRTGEYGGLVPQIDALRTFSVIPAQQAKSVTRITWIGNRAAHDHVGVIAWVVEWMVATLRTVLEECVKSGD